MGLLEQGLSLMLVGMGTVFTFLTLLVGATSTMSKIVLAMSPPVDPVSGGDEPASAEELAAIAAAVHLHRHRSARTD